MGNRETVNAENRCAVFGLRHEAWCPQFSVATIAPPGGGVVPLSWIPVPTTIHLELRASLKHEAIPNRRMSSFTCEREKKALPQAVTCPDGQKAVGAFTGRPG